jgi:hypothetical protein
MRIIFICKQRSYGISSGLHNSARLVAEMLEKHGIVTKVVSVVDANQIDREVHLFKPTHVAVEAIWVTPDKMEELVKLHKKVRWIVRLHSKVPFIATEGIAIDWIRSYHEKGIMMAPNSSEFHRDLENSMGIKSVLLPNYYPLSCDEPRSFDGYDKHKIVIGCFGAIRPLKNQLMQAMAAMSYAEAYDKVLEFHINAGRVERGDEVLKNIRAMFRRSKHKLVEHGWCDHSDFIKLVKTMHVGLQVSYTESFNIVSADFVACGIPIVGSPDIDILDPLFKADPNSCVDIRHAIGRALFLAKLGFLRLNNRKLKEYDEDSEKRWMEYLHDKH